MSDRSHPSPASRSSVEGPRGGAKPKLPPVPKLDPAQIQHLKSWADKHLQHAKLK
jgi:hypothetical protein